MRLFLPINLESLVRDHLGTLITRYFSSSQELIQGAVSFSTLLKQFPGTVASNDHIFGKIAA